MSVPASILGRMMPSSTVCSRRPALALALALAPQRPLTLLLSHIVGPFLVYHPVSLPEPRVLYRQHLEFAVFR